MTDPILSPDATQNSLVKFTTPSIKKEDLEGMQIVPRKGACLPLDFILNPFEPDWPDIIQ